MRDAIVASSAAVAAPTCGDDAPQMEQPSAGHMHRIHGICDSDAQEEKETNTHNVVGRGKSYLRDDGFPWKLTPDVP